jgi:hypothetical protein
MKQNPSRRQSSTSYLDTLRAEFDARTQRLQEAETAANTAQQEADAKRRSYHELEQRSLSSNLNSSLMSNEEVTMKPL